MALPELFDAGLRAASFPHPVSAGGVDLSLHDELAYDFDSVLSAVGSAFTGGEPNNPTASRVGATEGEA